jgi:hypothetical protein
MRFDNLLTEVVKSFFHHKQHPSVSVRSYADKL